MNYPFSTPSPYIHAAMSHAFQAMMAGGALPPNCVIMAMPMQQAQQILPQLMRNSVMGGGPMTYPQPPPYYGPSPYTNNPPLPQQNYNYPIVPYKNSKKKHSHPPQPHSNIYNSSSFDSYMDDLSWSRLFDHPSRKNYKHQPQQNQTSGNSSKPQRSDSSTSSSSTTSDETIRRVNVTNKQSSNINFKQQTKGSLPFKYSSEFVPGIGKQQSQKIKSNDVFIIKKP
jgi:hypothetical protein